MTLSDTIIFLLFTMVGFNLVVSIGVYYMVLHQRQDFIEFEETYYRQQRRSNTQTWGN